MPATSATLTATPMQNQIYAKTLLDMGMGIKRVARKLKMGFHTVIAIKRSQAYSPHMMDEFKRRLPYKSYKWADDVLDIITPEEVQKAPLTAKVMLYGVAIDKARDMEGSNRPIFNIVSIVNETRQTMAKLNLQLASIKSIDGASHEKGIIGNTSV